MAHTGLNYIVVSALRDKGFLITGFKAGMFLLFPSSKPEEFVKTFLRLLGGIQLEKKPFLLSSSKRQATEMSRVSGATWQARGGLWKGGGGGGGFGGCITTMEDVDGNVGCVSGSK